MTFILDGLVTPFGRDYQTWKENLQKKIDEWIQLDAYKKMVVDSGGEYLNYG